MYEQISRHIRVVFNGEIVADTRRTIRVLQTGIPPVYYIPQDDVRLEYYSRAPHHSWCEFKGQAGYWSLQVGEKTGKKVAWSYPTPLRGAEIIKDYLAFYVHMVDAGYVDDELAEPPDWTWAGGWVTSEIVGPFITREDVRKPRAEEKGKHVNLELASSSID